MESNEVVRERKFMRFTFQVWAHAKICKGNRTGITPFRKHAKLVGLLGYVGRPPLTRGT